MLNTTKNQRMQFKLKCRQCKEYSGDNPAILSTVKLLSNGSGILEWVCPHCKLCNKQSFTFGVELKIAKGEIVRLQAELTNSIKIITNLNKERFKMKDEIVQLKQVTEKCPKCGQAKLIELTIERHESWKFCNGCLTCLTEPMIVPKNQVIAWLKEEGFSKDAQRVKEGKAISEDGE